MKNFNFIIEKCRSIFPFVEDRNWIFVYSELRRRSNKRTREDSVRSVYKYLNRVKHEDVDMDLEYLSDVIVGKLRRVLEGEVSDFGI